MNEMARQALEATSDLKIIMKGEVVEQGNEKIGVTSTIFVSTDKTKVEKIFNELCQQYPDKFYMIYAIDLDEELDKKEHYPSIAISAEDLK